MMKPRLVMISLSAVLGSVPGVIAGDTFTMPPDRQCKIELRRANALDSEHVQSLEERAWANTAVRVGADVYFAELWRGVSFTHPDFKMFIEDIYS